LNLEQQITIMGGKHTLPRCQHYKDKQCGKPASKDPKYCAAHQSVVNDFFAGDIDAANRARNWLFMVEQAKASASKFLGQEYRGRQRKF